MSQKDCQKFYELIIEYKLTEKNSDKGNKNQNEKTESEEKIRIFGEKFVNKNKGKIKIIYENHEYELTEYLEDIDIDKEHHQEDLVTLNLRFVENNIDMSYMFFNCSKLFSISNNININNLNDTLELEENFKSIKNEQLTTLKNETKSNSLLNNDNYEYEYDSFCQQSSINKINIGNTTDSDVIFQGNDILSSEPKINVINMSNMFYGCISLELLPDISKWDTSKVNNMSNMFNGCNSLKSLPDIKKLNTSNVIDMSNIFYRCISLKSLPDISNWNTSNVTDMKYQVMTLINYIHKK